MNRIILCFLFFANSVYAEEVLITLKTRTDVLQKFLLVEAENPDASVILFAGGHGNLGLKSDSGMPSLERGRNNFLVRTRDLFVKHGFTIAVVDAPSDRSSSDGMFYKFRTSIEHVNDIDHVIGYLKENYHVPIWLIGTSRGTESAAFVMIHSSQEPAGAVLTSSMSEENNKGIDLTDLNLQKINAPVLLIAHMQDDCWVTPASGAKEIAAKLKNSINTKTIYFEGGSETKDRPCSGLSRHGFIGIEEDVVESIARFIKRDLN